MLGMPIVEEAAEDFTPIEENLIFQARRFWALLQGMFKGSSVEDFLFCVALDGAIMRREHQKAKSVALGHSNSAESPQAPAQGSRHSVDGAPTSLPDSSAESAPDSRQAPHTAEPTPEPPPR
jgi:hypothetical protein